MRRLYTGLLALLLVGSVHADPCAIPNMDEEELIEGNYRLDAERNELMVFDVGLCGWLVVQRLTDLVRLPATGQDHHIVRKAVGDESRVFQFVYAEDLDRGRFEARLNDEDISSLFTLDGFQERVMLPVKHGSNMLVIESWRGGRFAADGMERLVVEIDYLDYSKPMFITHIERGSIPADVDTPEEMDAFMEELKRRHIRPSQGVIVQ